MSKRDSFQVEFINEIRLAVPPDQTILEASLRAGIPHYHVCGGRAQCSTCRILVEEGAELLSPPNEAERAVAERMGFPRGVRLACQTRVRGGPVRLHRLLRDETDRRLFVKSGADMASYSLGEQRRLALFFVDIRNFTPFAESHLPYDVIHILNRFFNLVREAVEEKGGRTIEVAGDSLYAVFGMEGELPAGVESAVGAGLGILDRIQRFNDSYVEPLFGQRISVGIGVHVGRVIVGHIGIGVEGALSVIGHPVNVAARIQAATKEVNNDFLVSEAAFRLLRHPPGGVSSTRIDLKGVREPVRVYLLGRPYESPSR
ncbi:MAG: adenylate/guanylate cyclase domain-containing protein [Deltaproteobacteria bacterium]|nr:adenylate/guanylate cyclase domain-containing protein [Deltaproteobacteria bacterium]MBW2121044.1 adenylate/guanylate cyclase domain-containing protein [Deltaproteobacteria bacterium]